MDSPLFDKYSALILDQWGVLHDGARPCNEEVIPVLHDLVHKKRKKLAVLSNSSRRSTDTFQHLAEMGFDAGLFHSCVTSGEISHTTIQSKARALGRPVRLVWLTQHADEQREGNAAHAEHGRGFFRQLEQDNVVRLCGVDEADAIFANGTTAIVTGSPTAPAPQTDCMYTGSTTAYENLLTRAAARSLPLLCGNPDLYALSPDGQHLYQAGTIAKRYEELQGKVEYFGKPHREHFDACLQLLGVSREEALHVGDSLLHDIRGANAAGVDSLLVLSGVHAAELADMLARQPADPPELVHHDRTAAAVRELCAKYTAFPTFAVGAFARGQDVIRL
eukprot:m.202150 g.202150  ORF g.202150 m.202150 type:complete len:334 (+) comp21951_c0_seq1:881-1882(+)